MLYCGIYTGSTNTKILEFWNVNLRTMQSTRKEFDKSNTCYKATAVRKPRSDSSKKITPEFATDIKAMIDNKPQQVNQIHSQEHGSVCDFYLAGNHEDIWLFSYKIRQG